MKRLAIKAGRVIEVGSGISYSVLATRSESVLFPGFVIKFPHVVYKDATGRVNFLSSKED